METVTHHNPPEPASPRGHERTDASASGVVKFAIGLAVGVLIVQLAVHKLRHRWVRELEAADPPPSPVADLRQPPPEPELQPSAGSHEQLPWQDMESLRTQWRQELESYGRLPNRDDAVRIPIARAMELFSARGLPTTSPTTQPSTRPSPAAVGGGQ